MSAKEGTEVPERRSSPYEHMESTVFDIDTLEFVNEEGNIGRSIFWQAPDGQTTSLYRYTSQSAARWVAHSATYQAMVVAGRVTLTHEIPGGTNSVELGRGSSWIQRSGEAHKVSIADGEDAILHVHFDGPTNAAYGDTSAVGERAMPSSSTIGSPYAGLETTITPFDEVEMADVGGGLKIGMVWTLKDGRAAALCEYGPNTPSNGLHFHTHTYQSLIMSGGVKHWQEGSSEENTKLIGAGSMYVQKGGETHLHSEAYASDEPTLLLVIWDGENDVTWPYGKPESAAGP